MTDCSASADLLRLLAMIVQPPAERHAACAAILKLPSPGGLREWRIVHTAAFVQQCPPHASFIVGNDGNIGGEAADRVADFRRMLGASVMPGQVDGLPDLLADYAELVAQSDDDPRARHARTAMLWEHLLSWMMPYLDSVARSAPPPYDEWAMLTRDVLYAEANIAPIPERLPLHLRVAPAAADWSAAESAEQAIRMLLAPIQSGIVLTRADLARAPMQQKPEALNSRPFIVRHMLEQDARATLAWLAGEARGQARVREKERQHLGPIATFWLTRATATADTLAVMAGEPVAKDLAQC